MSTKEYANLTDFSGSTLTQDGVKKCLEELQKLVVGDDVLKNFKNENTYLLRFLHCTDFNAAAAFKRMQDYYKLVLENPDWFPTTSVLCKRERIEENSKTVLPGRDRQGRRILILKFAKFHERTSPQDETQLIDIYAESVLEQFESPETEYCVIMDLQGFPWKLVQYFKPSIIKVATKKFELYPIKKIIIHVVNTSPFLNAIITLVWPFFSDKTKEMVKFHFGNWPSLHEHIDPEVLSSEYGGTGPDVNFEKFHEFLYSNSAELEKKFKFRYLVHK